MYHRVCVMSGKHWERVNYQKYILLLKVTYRNRKGCEICSIYNRGPQNVVNDVVLVSFLLTLNVFLVFFHAQNFTWMSWILYFGCYFLSVSLLLRYLVQWCRFRRSYKLIWNLAENSRRIVKYRKSFRSHSNQCPEI